MTETNTYGIGNYNADHSTCSPILSNYDFDGHDTMTNIAEEIASQWKFDEQCRKNIEARMRGRQ